MIVPLVDVVHHIHMILIRRKDQLISWWNNEEAQEHERADQDGSVATFPREAYNSMFTL